MAGEPAKADGANPPADKGMTTREHATAAVGLLALVAEVAAVLALIVCIWPSSDCLKDPAKCALTTVGGSAADLAKRHDDLRTQLAKNLKDQADTEARIAKVDGDLARAKDEVTKGEQELRDLERAADKTPADQQRAGRAQQQRETRRDQATTEINAAKEAAEKLAKARGEVAKQLTEVEAKVGAPGIALKGATALSYDLRMLALMFLVGAMGGALHGISSWVTFWGLQRVKVSWLPWTLLRPVTGGILAVLLYLTLRGGLLSPAPTGGAAEQPINLYGFAALCGLAGLFTHEVMVRLRTFIGGYLQQTGSAAGPTVTDVNPKTFPLTAAQATDGQAVTLTGSGFTGECTVTVSQGAGFTIHKLTITAPAKIEFAIKADATAKAGTVKVAVEDKKTKKQEIRLVVS